MSDTNRKGILCASPSSEDECTIVSVLESDDSIINYDLYKNSCLDIVNVYRRDIMFCKTISGYISRQMLFLPHYNVNISHLQDEMIDLQPGLTAMRTSMKIISEKNESEYNNLLSTYSEALNGLFDFTWCKESGVIKGSMIHGNVLQDFITGLNIHRATHNAVNQSSIAAFTDELAILLPNFNTKNLGVSNSTIRNDKSAVRRMINGCKSIAMMFKTMKEQVCGIESFSIFVNYIKCIDFI